MKHEQAIRIFKEIQRRAYQVSEKPGVIANNCYFKGIELLQRLGILGYTVRGRIGETFWDDKIIPSEIISLYPREFLITHFYVEAEIDGLWRVLDPSFDPELKRAGFPVSEWKENAKPCFEITKLYNQQEQINYQQMWEAPAYAEAYFKKAGPFLNRFNEWLIFIRSGNFSPMRGFH